MGHQQSKHRRISKDELLKNTLLIQNWYRACNARLMKRFLIVWRIHEMLEYHNEKEQGNLYYFFQDLLQYLPKQRIGSKIEIDPRKSYNLSVHDLTFIKYFEANEFRKYDFDPVTFPLRNYDFQKLFQRVLVKKERIFPPSVVYNILCQSIKTFARAPNLNRVKVLGQSECCVIGDLHGSLEDLLLIFHRNGLPNPSNVYIFNGDYVDRGSNGVEVLCLILAAHLVFPDCVFLNRGNHEDCNMNRIYGFTQEVFYKYGRHQAKLMNKFNELYRWLPLATILNERVFIVHGGISNLVHISKLEEINRQEYQSILNMPNQINLLEWRIVFDLLWSDPMEKYGCVPNDRRNAGVFFGFNVTARFLNENHLKYIVRSHECKDLGYDYNHNSKVITVFSSSNYFGPGSNCGAYIKLKQTLVPNIFKYMVSNVWDRAALMVGRSIRELERLTLMKLCVRLKLYESSLIQAFHNADKKKNGLIHFHDWRNSLFQVSGIDIPWLLIRPLIAPKPQEIEVPANYVYYPATLNLLKTPEVERSFNEQVAPVDALFQNEEALEAIFHVMDLDNSGDISVKELTYVVDVLLKRLNSTYSREELLKVALQIDLNSDGKIELPEFLEAFRNCAKKFAK